MADIEELVKNTSFTTAEPGQGHVPPRARPARTGSSP